MDMDTDARASEREARLVEVGARLHSAAIHLLRRVRREDRASGLSAARLSALSVLVFGGPRTIGELAEAEQVRPPTMTRLVAGLEEDGYVARVSDPSDARVVRVEPTDAGRRVLEDGRLRRVRRMTELLGGLSEADLERLGEAVELIEAALEAADGAEDGGA